VKINRNKIGKPVRLDAEATMTVVGYAELTGKSEAWIASLIINRMQSVVTGNTRPTAVREYLDDLAEVQRVRRANRTREAEAQKKVRKLAPLSK
jgi:alpha-D-ribose 1-methylphosphonate 5-triphosphate synthase subunit PhnG